MNILNKTKKSLIKFLGIDYMLQVMMYASFLGLIGFIILILIHFIFFALILNISYSMGILIALLLIWVMIIYVFRKIIVRIS